MTGEEFTRPVRQLSSAAKKYINLRLNQIGLILAKRMAEITTSIITALLIAGFLAMIMLMLSLAFVMWYGSAVGSYAQGLLIVAAFYFLLGVVFYIARKKLISDPVVRIMNRHKTFTDISDSGENIPVNNMDDLEKRIELLKLQVQYTELQMEQNLHEVGDNLKLARILETLLDQILSSSIIIRILDYFFNNKKRKKKDKDKKDQTVEDD
jgi:hypothetical protein